MQYRSSFPPCTSFSTPVLDECFTNTVKRVRFLRQPSSLLWVVRLYLVFRKDSIYTCLSNRFTDFSICFLPRTWQKAFISKVCNSYTSPCTALPLLCCCWLYYMTPFPIKLFFCIMHFGGSHGFKTVTSARWWYFMAIVTSVVNAQYLVSQ